MDAELARLDAVGLAEAIRTGQLSPAEALESSIRRMEAVDGDINAVIHRHLDEARASIDSLPDGPFRGVPMLMKDLWACEAGRPHHQGVQALKDHGAVAARD
ncbi:MAG: amidase family protein, partial [Acidimicrobiales bacterium]|nr:amidase family protein [Acidimicrobiales bacterium]